MVDFMNMFARDKNLERVSEGRILVGILVYANGHISDMNIDTICLLKKGIININSIEKLIEIRGEEPSCIWGDSIKAFNNFCPEVNLFDEYHAFPYAKETATLSGEWDEFWQKENEFKSYKFGHFSECTEFNSYLSKEKLSSKNRRVSISKQLRFEVMQRDNFTRHYCGRNAEEGIKLHVDHIIPVADGGKTDFNNLITSCEDCNLGKSDKMIKIN